MICEKLQNVCLVAANPDQMDKNGYDFWTQRPPKPVTNFKSPKFLYTGDYLNKYQALQHSHKQKF